MADEPLSKAHQAVGAYFCAFSELERELGEALKVVLQLQNNPAANAIVGAVRDFARKANIVQEAILGAKNADGTEPTPEWKARMDKTMREILGCNSTDRTSLAHDYLEPHPDGSVSLQRPGQGARSWTSAELDGKIQKLKLLARELRTATAELATLKISVPTGWMETMMMDPYQPLRRKYAPSQLNDLVQPILPMDGAAQEKKD
jgi:hypothetical protein